MHDNVKFYDFIIPLLYITSFVCTVTLFVKKLILAPVAWGGSEFSQRLPMCVS